MRLIICCAIILIAATACETVGFRSVNTNTTEVCGGKTGCSPSPTN